MLAARGSSAGNSGLEASRSTLVIDRLVIKLSKIKYRTVSSSREEIWELSSQWRTRGLGT